MDTTEEQLRTLYKSHSYLDIRQGEIVIGKGMIEADLAELGYEKRELKKLCEQGLLKKVTTRVQGGWRNTYVLLPSKNKS